MKTTFRLNLTTKTVSVTDARKVTNREKLSKVMVARKADREGSLSRDQMLEMVRARRRAVKRKKVLKERQVRKVRRAKEVEKVSTSTGLLSLL